MEAKFIFKDCIFKIKCFLVRSNTPAKASCYLTSVFPLDSGGVACLWNIPYWRAFFIPRFFKIRLLTILLRNLHLFPFSAVAFWNWSTALLFWLSKILKLIPLRFFSLFVYSDSLCIIPLGKSSVIITVNNQQLQWLNPLESTSWEEA